MAPNRPRRKQPQKKRKPATTATTEPESMPTAVPPTTAADLIAPETIVEREFDEDFEIDTAAKAWIAGIVDQEKARLASLGATVTPLAVANFGLLVDSDANAEATNRVELVSDYDFAGISQLLVSEPMAYPARPNFKFVHVILFPSADATPMLVPYLYDSEFRVDGADAAAPPVKNALTEWLLINRVGQRAHHRVAGFEDV
ncbi:hypothetical protein H9P43_006348 [Blastocladiella emersonii ATCC 22665]|nr:hypothetical protein H9P43_006348 [Blastocladiella emersonii ATCC 22665]